MVLVHASGHLIPLGSLPRPNGGTMQTLLPGVTAERVLPAGWPWPCSRWPGVPGSRCCSCTATCRPRCSGGRPCSLCRRATGRWRWTFAASVTRTGAGGGGLGDYADDLAAVIEALGLTSVHLVGWSMVRPRLPGLRRGCSRLVIFRRGSSRVRTTGSPRSTKGPHSLPARRRSSARRPSRGPAPCSSRSRCDTASSAGSRRAWPRSSTGSRPA